MFNVNLHRIYRVLYMLMHKIHFEADACPDQVVTLVKDFKEEKLLLLIRVKSVHVNYILRNV